MDFIVIQNRKAISHISSPFLLALGLNKSFFFKFWMTKQMKSANKIVNKVNFICQKGSIKKRQTKILME